jgi:hypothetical protein
MLPMSIKKFRTYTGVLAYVILNKSDFCDLYIKKNLTAREVAEKMNVEFNNNLSKVLLRVCGKKSLGLGGKRLGSGMKKGTIRCKDCRRTLSNCNCKE